MPRLGSRVRIPLPAPGVFCVGDFVMAKGPVISIKLLSSAGTGYFYVTKKNPRTMTDKLELKKYDPRVRKHVIFKEHKIK